MYAVAPSPPSTVRMTAVSTAAPTADPPPTDWTAGGEETPAAAELRETRALLERALDERADLFQSSPVGYVQFDGQGVVADLNYRAAALLGGAGDRAIGLPLVHFVAPADHKTFHEYLYRCRRTTGTVRCELRLAAAPGANGGPVVQALSRRVRAGAGAAETYRCALVDVSELHAAEARSRRLHGELLRRTQEAESRSARLVRLHARVVGAEQGERERLARHLHDHLQQFLVAAKMQAHFAKISAAEGTQTPAELADTLGRLVELVDDALTSSRTLTSELTPPPVLRQMGLPAAMHWLADFYETRHGLRVEVRIGRVGDEGDEGDDLPGLSEAVRTLLFEAARELLLNVVKYAGVSAAEIRLCSPPAGGLRLTVTDEGAGFDADDTPDRPAGSPSGLGLFGLAERLEDVGGSTEIVSAPGRGTTVTVTVPGG